MSLVASINGKISHPLDIPLGSYRDRYRLEWLRGQADALLYGAGTVRKDRRPIVFTYPAIAQLVSSVIPPIFVVCRTLDFDWSNPFWDTATQITICKMGQNELAQPPSHIRVRAFPTSATLRDVLIYMAELGHKHVLCEGGGQLFAFLLNEQLVDELFLTVSPWLIDGEGLPSIVSGDFEPARLRLVSSEVVDQEVFLCYRVPEKGSGSNLQATSTHA